MADRTCREREDRGGNWDQLGRERGERSEARRGRRERRRRRAGQPRAPSATADSRDRALALRAAPRQGRARRSARRAARRSARARRRRPAAATGAAARRRRCCRPGASAITPGLRARSPWRPPDQRSSAPSCPTRSSGPMPPSTDGAEIEPRRLDQLRRQRDDGRRGRRPPDAGRQEAPAAAGSIASATNTAAMRAR